MTVSIPEKTLEHWASIYLSYRFRSKAQLWWPVDGEDINLGWLPNRAGKAVMLELKTTTLDSNGDHSVVIDLAQLQKYQARRRWLRPFYVFPIPDWNGDFITVAKTNRVIAAECAFQRSGPEWWFGSWTWVLTSDDVASILAAQIAAKQKTAAALTVKLDPVSNKFTEKWAGTGAVRPAGLVAWPDFWRELNACGRDGWPQVLLIPDGFLPASERNRVSRDAINRYRYERRLDKFDPDQSELRILRYVPDRDGGFVPEESVIAQEEVLAEPSQSDGEATVLLPLDLLDPVRR